MSDWRQVSTVLAGDSAEYAVDDFKKLFNLLLAGNQTLVDIASTGKWRFRDNVLQLSNPGNTFRYNIRTSAIAADRDVTLGALTANGNFAITGNDNDFGAGTNQIFRDGTIRLQPPSASPFYTISYGTGPAANRTLSIPVLTANANFVFDSFANTFTASQTFTVSPILNNGIRLQGKDSTAVARNLVAMVNDDAQFGSNHPTGHVYFVANGALVGSFANSGIFSVTKPAQAGVAETVAKFSVLDDATSALTIFNAFTTDAFFGPILRLYSAGTASTGNYIQGMIQNTFDTGSSAALQITARTDIGSIANRALLEINNNTTNVFKINAKGDVLYTVTAQASVAEVLAVFQMSDDASVFGVYNGTATDLVFSPWLKGSLSTNHGSNTNALRISGFIPTSQDTGTTPALRLDASLQSGGALTTRPLLALLNSGSTLFTVGANGDILQTVLARTGITEAFFDMKVSDNAGFIRFTNNTSTDGAFGGQLDVTLASGSVAGTVAMIYVHRILAANDSGSNPVVQFQAKTTVFGDITVRPVYDFVNNATSLLKIMPKGRLTHSHQDEGFEEIFYQVTLSDAANSYFNIGNAIGGVASSFAPRLWGHNAATNATYAGLFIYGSVIGAQDSGAVGIITLDARLDAATVVVNRPLVAIRNASAVKYLFYPTKADFLHNQLDKVWGVQQAPFSTRWTSWVFTPTTTGSGSGVFNQGCTFTGTLSSTNDAGGGFCRMTAAASVDAIAACDSTLSVSGRASLPRLQGSVVLDSVTDVRFKWGVCTAGLTTGATSIGAGNAGVIFRFIYGTDTTFKVVSNDANGSTADTTVVDTGITPAAATQYEFEIEWDGTNWNWEIYNSSGVSIATGNLSGGAVPSSSHIIFTRMRTENTTTTAKSWFFRWINISKAGTGPAIPYN